MDRRDFLKTGGALAIAASGVARAESPLAAGRFIYSLNRGWRYRDTSTAETHAPDFDDSAFAHVTVPHTNVMLPWHGFEDRSFEFVSIYRRMIHMPAEAAGRRVFVDFEGVMTAATVWLNGKRLGEYRGGYTPFSFELTEHIQPGDNLLAVDVDSTERKDIPPFGFEIDYLTFGGIYREVSLRIVPQVFLENIHARTVGVLTSKPSLEIDCFLDRAAKTNVGKLTVHAELRDGDRIVARGSANVPLPEVANHEERDADQSLGSAALSTDKPSATIKLNSLRGLELWDLHNPKLYTVHVQLHDGKTILDEDESRIGFREAVFTPQGFSLNGKIVKLHGLDRHQTFPWVGQAMPARGQRQDAVILKRDLRCNIVRTSHYPQSRHFLDACDEIGLLVLEEIPGWQHIGNESWQNLAVDNVRRMVRRDWNHPSIILWGTRINESKDHHDFYSRTNLMAKALDGTRQTCGIRNFEGSELIEDVFTVNDFGFPLREPNHPLYLNTEFVGHTFPTKTIDSLERLREHTVRHARVHDQLASSPQYAGGLGWCAFDYATHANFGSGDRICYHGVMDIFRTPKPAAGFYKSMCEREEEIVLEPAFHWAQNDESVGLTRALICSNVDHIKMYTVSETGDTLAGEGDPDREQFPHLKYAPFNIAFLHEALRMPNWGDLRIDGYIDGKLAISKKYSGKGADQQFVMLADDVDLDADGSDMVRVVLRVNDEYGNVRPFATDAIELNIDGPGEIVGSSPFSLIGGTGAIWVRAGLQPGTVTLKGKHPTLGVQVVVFNLTAVEPETV